MCIRIFIGGKNQFFFVPIVRESRQRIENTKKSRIILKRFFITGFKLLVPTLITRCAFVLLTHIFNQNQKFSNG